MIDSGKVWPNDPVYFPDYTNARLAFFQTTYKWKVNIFPDYTNARLALFQTKLMQN